jgi:hypothetical protein
MCQHSMPLGHVVFASQGNSQTELHTGVAVPLGGRGQSSAVSHS